MIEQSTPTDGKPPTFNSAFPTDVDVDIPDVSGVPQPQAGHGDQWITEDDMLLIEQSPEEMRQNCLEYFLRSQPPDVTEVSEEDFNGWFDSLTGDNKAEIEEELDRLRTEEDVMLQEQELAEAEIEYAPIKDMLSETAPELLEGKLPADLATRLGRPYMLGINQTGAHLDAAEASEELEDGGLSMKGYQMSQQLLFVDEQTPPDYTEYAVVQGYYGKYGGGKYVIAIPFGPDIADSSEVRALPDELMGLPDDYFIEDQQGKAISNKYCAGYIDATGRFNRNPTFMESNEVPWTTPDAQAVSR